MNLAEQIISNYLVVSLKNGGNTQIWRYSYVVIHHTIKTYT